MNIYLKQKYCRPLLIIYHAQMYSKIVILETLQLYLQLLQFLLCHHNLSHSLALFLKSNMHIAAPVERGVWCKQRALLGINVLQESLFLQLSALVEKLLPEEQ